MCFAPQRRALFRQLNFQKCSEHLVLLTCWLRIVLRATTACTFSTSQLPKVVRAWCVLYILTSKCASRDNGVQFFISHLARWLHTRRFSELTFRPSRATNHWKNAVFRDFPIFSHTCIFFLLTLSLLWFSLFYSSLLSDSSHLFFSSVHIVGSLTSKLPSIIKHSKYRYIYHKTIVIGVSGTNLANYWAPPCMQTPKKRGNPKQQEMKRSFSGNLTSLLNSLGVLDGRRISSVRMGWKHGYDL